MEVKWTWRKNEGLCGYRMPLKQIPELVNMCLTEFDEKKYEDVLREEGREEGLAEGLEKGLAKGRKTEVFVSVQEGDYGVVRGAQKLNLSVEEFEKEMSAAGYQIPVEI
jgi:predicted transposase YdaD